MNITIEAVMQIISMQIGIKEIEADQRLAEDLAAESADLVNIIAKIEKKYQLVFPEEEIANIRTVNDIYLVAFRILNQ